MSVKRFDGTSWIEAANVKRFDGSNWVAANSLKRFDGTNWIEALKKELVLYDNGDQKTAITGGWTRQADSWLQYMTKDGGEYITYGASYIEVKTTDWSGNKLPATVNPIDITIYSKINIIFDILTYQASTYNNGMEWGVVAGPPAYWYGTGNPPTTFCSGYNYRILRAADQNNSFNNVWQLNKTHSIDISDLTGNWYVLLCPWSWSWYGDTTTVRIKKIWLS